MAKFNKRSHCCIGCFNCEISYNPIYNKENLGENVKACKLYCL